MTAQNLVSASIEPADVDAVLQHIEAIKGKLSFLHTLTPDEMRSLVKAGNAFGPFVDKAAQVAANHPEILPAVFDRDEFLRDYRLMLALTQIAGPLLELANGVENTLTAARSDAMNGALEIYSSVKTARDRVPGLNVQVDEMASHFRRGRRKPLAAAPDK